MLSGAENKELAVMTIILLLLSILCRFVTGIFLSTLIRETDNMAVTQNPVLKQCRAKFSSCYRLNNGVPNIGAFVDRFLARLRIGRFSLDTLSRLAGQLMLLSAASAGLGACLGIASGKGISEILPFYLLGFLGMYIYFSVSGLADPEKKRELLKISLTDYLENHLAPRLSAAEASGAGEEKNSPGKEVPSGGEGVSEQERELEELLREFLI